VLDTLAGLGVAQRTRYHHSGGDSVAHRGGHRPKSSEGLERLLSSLIPRRTSIGAGRHQWTTTMHSNRSDMRMVIGTRCAGRLKTRVRDTSVQREPYPHSSSRGRLLLPLSLWRRSQHVVRGRYEATNPNHLGLEGCWHGYGLGFAEQRVGHRCLN
jgi:hypothetical protein